MAWASMARPLIEAEAEMEPPETEAGTGCEAPKIKLVRLNFGYSTFLY